jgi:transposase
MAKGPEQPKQRRSLSAPLPLCNTLTLGITGYQPLRRDRRAQLAALRTPEGDPLATNAAARIGRILDRLELVMQQIAELEQARDAVLAKEARADA